MADNWQDVVASPSAHHQPSSSILDWLKAMYQVVSDAAVHRVAGSSRPVMNTWTICMLISSDRISCTLAYWTYLLSKQSSKQFLFIYQRPQLIRCCQKYSLFGTRIHATHYVAWTQPIGQLWIAQWQLAVAQFSAENYSVCPVAYNAHAIFPICQRYHFTDRTNFLDFSWQFFRIDMQETHETSHELCS